MRSVWVLAALLLCAMLAGVATASSASEEAEFAAELDAALGAAHAMSTAASFRAEAEMHLALSQAAAASMPPPADKLNVNAPQQATAAVATAVFDFCTKPVAQSPQTLRGFVALAGRVADPTDPVSMCIRKMVDAFDQGPLALAKLAPGACLSGITSAEILLRVKVLAEDPSNPYAPKYQKLVKFFEEHPLVQYAFSEALSVAIDLAASGGDFLGVATKHAKAWAIEIHNAVAAPLWNGLKSGLAALQNQFAGAAMATLTAARKEIYEFIYKNSPPSVRAAIGTLNDAVLADQSANAIKEELFATAPGKAFVAARDKFRQSAMAVLTNVGQLALGMAATVASAPTGLGAAMAGLSTAVAFKQVAFARDDAALAFCEMQRAWQSCLASVTGKRFQEAETYAVKKWAEARQSAVTLLTGSTGSAASAVPSASTAATPPPAGMLSSWSYGLLG